MLLANLWLRLWRWSQDWYGVSHQESPGPVSPSLIHSWSNSDSLPAGRTLEDWRKENVPNKPLAMSLWCLPVWPLSKHQTLPSRDWRWWRMEGSQLTPCRYYLPPTLRKSAAAARPGGHIQPLRHHLAGGRGREGKPLEGCRPAAISWSDCGIILNPDQIQHDYSLLAF